MQALDKTLAILEAFLDEGEPLRLSDLAEKTGLNKSTTRVIASALVERGYLVQTEKRGKYFLGLKFIEFARVVEKQLSLRDVAVPFLTELMEQVNEVAELTVLDRDYVTVLVSVEAHRLLSVSGIGKWAVKIPLHQTACGKVLAAYLPAQEWAEIRDGLDLAVATPHTIATIDELEAELARVRAAGMAIDDEEAEVGIRSISVPVMDAAGTVIAAVDIVGPSLRLTDEMMNAYKPLVKGCALGISRALGYAGPPAGPYEAQGVGRA